MRAGDKFIMNFIESDDLFPSLLARLTLLTSLTLLIVLTLLTSLTLLIVLTLLTALTPSLINQVRRCLPAPSPRCLVASLPPRVVALRRRCRRRVAASAERNLPFRLRGAAFPLPSPLSARSLGGTEAETDTDALAENDPEWTRMQVPTPTPRRRGAGRWLVARG